MTHEVKFSDPPIANALAEMGKVLKNPDYVNGGIGDVKYDRFDRRSRTAACRFSRVSATFHRQATFYEANWPKGTKVGPDGDVNAFYLPGIDAQFGKPVLVGGDDLVVAFADAPAVWALQYYFTTPFFSNDSGKAGLMASRRTRASRRPPSPARSSRSRQAALQGSGNRDPVRCVGSDAGTRSDPTPSGSSSPPGSPARTMQPPWPISTSAWPAS